MDPVPDPLLLRRSGSAVNRTWTSGSVARNSEHQTTEAVSCMAYTSYLRREKLCSSDTSVDCSDYWAVDRQRRER
jgi:hypothetical protein